MQENNGAKMYFFVKERGKSNRPHAKQRLDCSKCGGSMFFEDKNTSPWYAYFCAACHRIEFYMIQLEARDDDTGFAGN